MSTITKEWLQQTIAEYEANRDELPFGLDTNSSIELQAFKLALASLEAEPVCVIDQPNLDYLKSGADADVWPASRTEMGDVFLYRSAQPAPVSVPDNEQCKPHPVMAFKGELGFLDHFDRIISERDEDIDIGQLGSSNYEALMLAALDAFRAAMLQGAEPVSNRDELLGLIEGMEVSVDVSTSDTDAGHRYFGTVTEVSELDGAKNGYILLVQDAEPNFKHTGNSPVIPDGLRLALSNAGIAVPESDEMLAATCEKYIQALVDWVKDRKPFEPAKVVPDGWVACSERMPDENAEKEVLACFKGGDISTLYYFEGRWDDAYGIVPIRQDVTHWMPLPAAPQQEE